MRTAVPWVLLALSPFLIFFEIWLVLAIDAFRDYNGEHESVNAAELREDRFARWRDPPAVSGGDWEFRWGVSNQWSPVGPYEPTPFSEWAHFFEALDPDIVRIFLSWRSVQPTPGAWNEEYLRDHFTAFVEAGYEIQAPVHRSPKWAATGGLYRHLGISAWARMPPKGYDSANGPYADFLRELHERYPSIRIFQIWNEPDWPHGLESAKLNPLAARYWRGSATDYGEMLAANIPVVREFGPGYEVSTGGVSIPSYLETVLDVPGARKADIYDLHFASGDGRPDVDLKVDRMMALVDKHLDTLAAVGIDTPQISISELSFPYSEAGERDQADFVTKAYSVGNALGWGVLTWFATGPHEPSYYTDSGLVDFDHTTRQSFDALRFNKIALDGLEPTGLAGDGKDVRIATFETAQGEPAWVAWSLTGAGAAGWPADAGPGVVYDGLGNRTGDVRGGDTVELDERAVYILPESSVPENP